jgi:hypothetical protein
MTTFQKTTTAAGNLVTYGTDHLATWLEIDHGNDRRTSIYATPGWIGGLERIRELIVKHGIKIMPQHIGIFSQITLSDAA